MNLSFGAVECANTINQAKTVGVIGGVVRQPYNCAIIPSHSWR
jgi:hypothetical protein